MLLVRCLGSALLLWFVSRNLDVSDLMHWLGDIESPYVFIAIGCLASQVPLAAFRWRLVTRALCVELPYVACLRFHLIGVFFSQALPASVGADGVRVWLHRRAGAGLENAVHGVVLDRFFGLLALLGLVALGSPIHRHIISDPIGLRVLTVLAIIGGAGLAMVAVIGLTRIGQSMPLGWTRLLWLARLGRSMRTLIRGPGQMTGLGGLSVALHLLSVAAIWCLAPSVGVEISPLGSVVLIPPIFMVALLPITIASWGLREGAMAVMLGYAAVAPIDAVLVSVMFGLSLMLISFAGGIVWIAEGAPRARDRGGVQ